MRFRLPSRRRNTDVKELTTSTEKVVTADSLSEDELLELLPLLLAVSIIMGALKRVQVSEDEKDEWRQSVILLLQTGRSVRIR